MKSVSHSQQLKWSMGAIKKGGSVNITTPAISITCIAGKVRAPPPQTCWRDFIKGGALGERDCEARTVTGTNISFASEAIFTARSQRM